MNVTIVDYNSGNISSVINSFKEVAKAKVNIDYNGPDTIFLGYKDTSATAKLLHILKDDKSVENLKEKEKGLASQELLVKVIKIELQE